MAEPTADELIAATLEQARSLLGTDAAHLGRFIYGYQEIDGVAGDADQFGLTPGLRVPLTETVCRLMTMGRVPQLIPDVRAEPALAGLAAVKEGMIGAYVGVPVFAADGTEFGTLCCISGRAEPHLSEAHLEGLKALADRLGQQLQLQRGAPARSAAAVPGRPVAGVPSLDAQS